jgi:hypothetical protein
MIMTTMPEAMTIRQNGRPRFFWLVAFLLRLPRIVFPSSSMATPSMTKHDLWLKSGQFRVVYDLNRGSSVMIRKAADIVSQRRLEKLSACVLLMTIVITCWHPSKKKNLLTTKVLTSMTELAAMTASRLIMLRTRMTLRTT